MVIDVLWNMYSAINVVDLLCNFYPDAVVIKLSMFVELNEPLQWLEEKNHEK